MLQHGPDHVEYVKLTFVEIGVPVFHGGFSTFLVALMLSTAASCSMRLFFNMFVMQTKSSLGII
jgi:hypothetical protein